MNATLQTAIGVTIIFLPVLLCVFVFTFFYNALVSKEEEVLANWSQVETMYQRRTDIVPALVATVKGFAEQEKSVLTDVTEARNQLSQALDALEKSKTEADSLSKDAQTHLDDESYMEKLATAQKRVGRSMTSIFALSEAYPSLKSSDNFLTLQDQLEGVENRINVTRMIFNESVRDYNAAIRKMPGSLVASMGNFRRKAYYEADEGAENAVKVEF